MLYLYLSLAVDEWRYRVTRCLGISKDFIPKFVVVCFVSREKPVGCEYEKVGIGFRTQGKTSHYPLIGGILDKVNFFIGLVAEDDDQLSAHSRFSLIYRNWSASNLDIS